MILILVKFYPRKKKSAKHHPNIHPKNLNQGFFFNLKINCKKSSEKKIMINFMDQYTNHHEKK